MFPLITSGVPLAISIAKLVQETVERMRAEKANISTPELADETARQRLITQQLVEDARLQQELAIAARISSSQYVEIDEYYDVMTEGHGYVDVSVQPTKKTGVKAGGGGFGSRITHRKYKFTGFRGEEIDEFVQESAESDPPTPEVAAP
jgi:hypothetical protein